MQSLFSRGRILYAASVAGRDRAAVRLHARVLFTSPTSNVEIKLIDKTLFVVIDQLNCLWRSSFQFNWLSTCVTWSLSACAMLGDPTIDPSIFMMMVSAMMPHYKPVCRSSIKGINKPSDTPEKLRAQGNHSTRVWHSSSSKYFQTSDTAMQVHGG